MVETTDRKKKKMREKPRELFSLLARFVRSSTMTESPAQAKAKTQTQTEQCRIQTLR